MLVVAFSGITRLQILLIMVPDDGKHAFSLIGVREIEATIVWRGGFGGRGAVHGFAGQPDLVQFLNFFKFKNGLVFMFFYLGSECSFLCLLGATWMQKKFKRGLRVILLDSKS